MCLCVGLPWLCPCHLYTMHIILYLSIYVSYSIYLYLYHTLSIYICIILYLSISISYSIYLYTYHYTLNTNTIPPILYLYISLYICIYSAHLKMMPDVPLVGWDVAFTSDGIYLLEVNLSCNFFMGNVDMPAYISLLDEYWMDLDRKATY